MQGVSFRFKSTSRAAQLNSQMRWPEQLELVRQRSNGELHSRTSDSENRWTAVLRALGLEDLSSALGAFWPKRGPSWDALALIRGASGPAGFLLAEGKSYPGEMIGNGCVAGDASRRLIDKSLRRAKLFFGVAETADWAGDYYQYANRLAHLFFLREQTKLPVWLVNLCFTNDPTKGATSEDMWRRELRKVKTALGFPGAIPFTTDVLLPGYARSELLCSFALPAQTGCFPLRAD
jgi:hypothetical protein